LVNLEEEQIEHIDQFIYRFTKLQDSMATRLLPAISSWLETDPGPKAFLDILNRLEQLKMWDNGNFLGIVGIIWPMTTLKAWPKL
jgi:hypothetical protein